MGPVTRFHLLEGPASVMWLRVFSQWIFVLSRAAMLLLSQTSVNHWICSVTDLIHGS
jgi:hypothetical protein